MKQLALSITDTREREHGSFGNPIPGTGETIPCACCSRPIQIHVLVCDIVSESDYVWSKVPGTERIIGLTCARNAGVRRGILLKNGTIRISGRAL